MLAADEHGNLTGYYREEQGEEVSKRCSFYLSGKAKDDTATVVTWSYDRTLPGQLIAVKDGVELKVPLGREHTGCGLVLVPEIARGVVLDRIVKKKWVELGVVKAASSLSNSSTSSGVSAFLPKGAVVGVVCKGKRRSLVQSERAIGWMDSRRLGQVEQPAR
ncbi:hypothetical protein LPW11_00585 [Geomonas sp. RF6]|uniref:hypothetical protein n=1 Tax=Geomonas sp. RF6 TaxID=2897342 RepID=UPI001E5E6A08|nr:hypothetical protein [Geomonas sp. RF6]UFS70701.1 hypothetical protein LPW11_00585 [Geomonas sp. RF6]